MGVVVEQVPAGAVLPLRAKVLRPGKRILDAAFDGDERGVHFAAYDEHGVIVGVASLLEEPTPGDGLPARRLRGMATAEGVRHQGVGSRLLEAVLEQAAAEGSALVWCAARAAAIGFYERHGFVGVGERYEVADIGPHLEMRQDLASGRS